MIGIFKKIYPAPFSRVLNPVEKIFLKTSHPRSKRGGIRERCWIKNPFYWLGSLIFSGLIFLMTNNAFAAGVGETTGVELPNPLGQGATFITIINNILNYLIIYISPPILAIMILVGGFQILTARDNPEKITKGKTTIMYAVIGFVIVLISKGVALILLKIIG